MFSGFGLRTLGIRCRAYNPMSYHNGSVWAHDNALIVTGLTGVDGILAKQVSTALFEVACARSDYRLPELFCGFPRKESMLPVPYPVSCVPQAWCAGAPYSLMASLLGLNIQAHGNSLKDRLKINNSALPDAINSLTISNLNVSGDGPNGYQQRRATIKIRRENGSIVSEVTEQE